MSNAASPHDRRPATDTMGGYDPFARGSYPVGVRTIEAHDAARGRRFPIEIWYPASGGVPRSRSAARDAAIRPDRYPLIVYSHLSGYDRRAASFLCTHLASHGYLVAALDHSERVAPELARRDGETEAQRSARAQAWIASRVPDIRFLLDHLLSAGVWGAESGPDPARIGIVGHSFGGWTALAAPDQEPRIRAVVAMAPGGSSKPRPGILPATLAFRWGRDVPTLYLVAENDVLTPLGGMYELFERTPATRKMVILRRADHSHFMDQVEQEHEALRAMPLTGDAAWIPREMRPIAELSSGEQAHDFARGLTLAHLDATLRSDEAARRFLAGDVAARLAERGIDAIVHEPEG